MANQQELTNWILSNQDALNLKVTELTWIRSQFPGMTDLGATITIGGAEFKGRGTDRHENRALGKAVCEAIERFLCHSLDLSSTGLAGHFDEERAKTNARQEFIERLALSRHVKNNLPPIHLRAREISFSIEGVNTKARLLYFKLATPSGYNAILVLAEGVSPDSNFGGVLGLGCSASESDAEEKAEIECYRTISALSARSILPLTREDFLKINRPRGEDRKRLLFDQSYCARLLQDLLRSTEAFSSEPIELALRYEHIELPKIIPAGCPLRFMRCQGDEAVDESVLEFVG